METLTQYALAALNVAVGLASGLYVGLHWLKAIR